MAAKTKINDTGGAKTVNASSKVKAFVPVISDPLNSGWHWARFGDSADNVPNKWIYAVKDSPTAKKCIRKIIQFVVGNGFDGELGNVLVNRSQKANDLLREIAQSAAYWDGAHALNIKYRSDGSPSEVFTQQISSIRKETSGECFYTNSRFGTSRRSMESEIKHFPFDRFESSEDRVNRVLNDIAESGIFSGDILYRFIPGEGFLGNLYPIPDAMSSLSDIEADAALSRYNSSLIKKGFRANTIISYPRRLNREVKDANEQTQYDRVIDSVSNFVGEDGDTVMILDTELDDAKVEIHTIDNKAALDSTEKMNESIPRAVCRAFGVPPVLIGFDTANVLGNSKALADSMKLFNLMVKDIQLYICETMKLLFPLYDWKIKSLNLFDYIDPQLLPYFTEDEIREMYGLSPKKNNQ